MSNSDLLHPPASPQGHRPRTSSGLASPPTVPSSSVSCSSTSSSSMPSSSSTVSRLTVPSSTAPSSDSPLPKTPSTDTGKEPDTVGQPHTMPPPKPSHNEPSRQQARSPKQPPFRPPPPHGRASPQVQGPTPDATPVALPPRTRPETEPPERPASRRTAKMDSPSMSSMRLPMPSISPALLAYSALLYLPVPILVLNDLKTVVMANEAMGRMLGLMDSPNSPDAVGDDSDVIEKLRGQSLAQVGVNMLQEGRPVWVSWEDFFDSLVWNVGVKGDVSVRANTTADAAGDQTPTAGHGRSSTSPTQDSVVEVVVARKGIGEVPVGAESMTAGYHVFAKMIVSVWEVEDHQTYFTLTFTSPESKPSSIASTKKPVARANTLEAAERRSISSATASTPSSANSSRDSRSPGSEPLRMNPDDVAMSSSPFPPMGPPSVAEHSSSPSILEKILTMRNAMVDAIDMPVLAMWKDGSVMYPNRAAREMCTRSFDAESATAEPSEMLLNWELWDEHFTRQLPTSEYPISVLVRTKTPFAGRRYGVRLHDDTKRVFGVRGEAIWDQDTGEFVAGIIICRDLTEMVKEIERMRQEEEDSFRLICDAMPQLVWTTLAATGEADFFNSRWYIYTGLTPEQSIGYGWTDAIHPDDLPKTRCMWDQSQLTGEPYIMEYRCRRADGEWRWHLARALPRYNPLTGKIEKWFGTCTDMHDSIVSKLIATQTRQQLRSVIAHSHVTIFTVDIALNITMLEGALIWNATGENPNRPRWYLGENMYDVFNRLNPLLPAGERPAFLRPVEDVISGKIEAGVMEHDINGRWYRTRFLPVSDKEAKVMAAESASAMTPAAAVGSRPEGAIGVIMDVTELKMREAALEEQSQAKQRAIASEAAAKEANRLKSQFLANMSHEIRTPITGVLGMSELLADKDLEPETREYVEIITRSANALLSVINDILDFSKIESGRLDIESVPFHPVVMTRDAYDVVKFSAARKGLNLDLEIADDVDEELVLVGDTGRMQQIITNLLTNSIKFTSQGFVKLSVAKERDTRDKVEMRFVIEDTGIGIEEDVRKKLFRPFSQGDASTARRFGGTGLGLTICQNLVSLMHGRITLGSAVGRGTKVTFWIPFQKPRGPQRYSVDMNALPLRVHHSDMSSCSTASSDGGQSRPSSVRAGKDTPQSLQALIDLLEALPKAERARFHILVAEDNKINQKIAVEMIRSLGFGVSAVWNGREVLEYVQAAQGGSRKKPDIILMDVQMPLIDGYKCTHLLRHHVPYKAFVEDIPIVAMTAAAIQGDRERCTRAGMDDYLSKPVKKMNLERMLVRWSLLGRAGRTGVATTTPAGSEACSGVGDHCSSMLIPEVDEQPTPIAAMDSNPMEFARPAWRPQSPESPQSPQAPQAPQSQQSSPQPPQSPQSPQSQQPPTPPTQPTQPIQTPRDPDPTGVVATTDTNAEVKALTEENIGRLELELGLERQTLAPPLLSGEGVWGVVGECPVGRALMDLRGGGGRGRDRIGR